jgi:tetratricopeptide (TPR) repeat protein
MHKPSLSLIHGMRTAVTWVTAWLLAVAAMPALSMAQSPGAKSTGETPSDTHSTLQATVDDATVAAWVEQGIDARKRRAFAEALALLNRALAARPSDTNVALAIAVTHEWADQLRKAQATYEQALKRDPRLAAAWVGLGRVLRWQHQLSASQGAYDRALEWLQTAPTVGDEGQQTHALTIESCMGLAQVAYERLDLEGAWRYTQRVLVLHPQHAAALALQQSLRTSFRDRVSVFAGQRKDATHSATSYQAEWTRHWDRVTQTMVGLGRGLTIQASASSLSTTVVSGNTAYGQWSRVVPAQEASMVRLQWQERPPTGDAWQIDATHTIPSPFSSGWRVHGGGHALRTSTSQSGTLEFGTTVTQLKPFDVGLTAFVGKDRNDAAGTVTRISTRVALLRVGWSEGPHQWQWFTSKPWQGGATSHALVGRLSVPSWPTVTTLLSMDGATRAKRVGLGLELPLGASRGIGMRLEHMANSTAWMVSASQSWNGLDVEDRGRPARP